MYKKSEPFEIILEYPASCSDYIVANIDWSSPSEDILDQVKFLYEFSNENPYMEFDSFGGSLSEDDSPCLMQYGIVTSDTDSTVPSGLNPVTISPTDGNK